MNMRSRKTNELFSNSCFRFFDAWFCTPTEATNPGQLKHSFRKESVVHHIAFYAQGRVLICILRNIKVLANTYNYSYIVTPTKISSYAFAMVSKNS